MGYTRQNIKDKCETAFRVVETFYQDDVINYRGETTDTGEAYTEVVAEFLLANLSDFQQSIPQITRTASYKTGSHDGEYSESSNRVEEVTAMKLFNHCKNGAAYDFIGQIIDYQTPLKSKRTDTAGKVDLLAYDGKTLRLLELKKPDSEETMLRCVLEGYTYLKTADTAKLLNNFTLPEDTVVVACPFVFRGGTQWAEMKEDRPNLKKLMTALDSKPFYILEKNGEYYIEEK